MRYEKVTSPPSTLYGPLNIASAEPASAPIIRATSSAEEWRGVMPRHEFLATGSDAAICEETRSISSPTAAMLRDKIICFFGDIKTQTPFLLAKR